MQLLNIKILKPLRYSVPTTDPHHTLLMLCSSGISFRLEVTLGHIKRSHGYIVMVYHIYTAVLYQVVLCCIIYIAISFITSICSQHKYVKRNRLSLIYDCAILFARRGDHVMENNCSIRQIKVSKLISIETYMPNRCIFENSRIPCKL